MATAVLRLRQLGDPVLRIRARSVAESRFGTRELARFCEQLVDVMRSANGAGIAAPQVGVSDRIFVVHGTGENPRYPYKPRIPLTVFVNPHIQVVDDSPLQLMEGCLSVPGFRGQVERPSVVRVTARRPDGSPFCVHAQGHAAGTMQHENDHLDGVLFPDISRPGPFGPEALVTWEAFDEHYGPKFLPYATEVGERYPEPWRIVE